MTLIDYAFFNSISFWITPFGTMLLFMDMEKMIGDDFAAGLNNLKKILED